MHRNIFAALRVCLGLAVLGAVAFLLRCGGDEFSALAPRDGAAEPSPDAGDELTNVIICSPCPLDQPADGNDGDANTESAAESGPESGLESGLQLGAEGGGCAASELLCGAVCVANDARHCGACSNDCTVLKNVSGPVSCALGACSFPASSCAAGYANCSGSPGGGCETDITRPAHCGSCNTVCSGGTPVCAPSGSGYGCVSGCPATAPTLCGGTCVDTTNNASNCSMCNNACATSIAHAQPVCAGGTCGFSCNAGYSKCSGGCADYSNDPQNCGGCANTCPSNGECISGACQCPLNTLLCSGVCATCNTPSNAIATCSGTSCSFACDTNYTQCGNSCANLQTDANNCGGCGRSCGAGATCNGGQCQLGTFSGTPTSIGVDSNNVYATVLGASDGSGTVQECSLSSGCSGGASNLVTGLSRTPGGMAVSSVGVYWVETAVASGTQYVKGCPGASCAGSAVTYTTYTFVAQAQVAADASNVYFLVSNSTNDIMRCPASATNCSPTLVCSANAPAKSLAVIAGNVLFTSGPTPTLKDCQTTYATAASSEYWYFLVTDPSFAYWLELPTAKAVNGNVEQVCLTPKCSGLSTVGMGALSPTQWGQPIVVDSNYVYWWMAGTNNGSRVVKCAKSGCSTPTTVLDNVANSPNLLAIDATYLYYLAGSALYRFTK